VSRNWDLRDHIAVGDTIQYESMKAIGGPEDIQRRSSILYVSVVDKVYRDFVLVRLRRTLDCANRWNIMELNGKPFGLEG